MAQQDLEYKNRTLTTGIIVLFSLAVILVVLLTIQTYKVEKYKSESRQISIQLSDEIKFNKILKANLVNTSFQMDQLQTENYNLLAKQTDLNNYVSDLQSDLSFLDIAQEIAQAHNWTYKKYMCGNFAFDLVQALKVDGWSAEKVSGYWYQNGNGTCSDENYDRFRCKHYWVIVQVPIEATSGKIIDPATYKQEYKS